MDLLEALRTHDSRHELAGYYPDHPDIGLCCRCFYPITSFGRNKSKCEYHWLKSKHKEIVKKCTQANKKYRINMRNKHLIGISCTFSWEEFIIWCIKNDQYKVLKDPALLRIDRTKNYSLDNIRWGEMKEIAMFLITSK